MHYYCKHYAFGLEILRCVLFNAENLSVVMLCSNVVDLVPELEMGVLELHVQ